MISKINIFAPYVILAVLVFTFNLNLMQSILCACFLGVLSAIVSLYFDERVN